MFKPIADMAHKMLELDQAEPIPPRYVAVIERAEALMFRVCRRTMEFRTSELAVLLASVPEPPKDAPEPAEVKPEPPAHPPAKAKRGPGRPRKHPVGVTA